MEAEFSEAITDPSEIFICWFILWLKSYVEVNVEISSVDKYYCGNCTETLDKWYYTLVFWLSIWSSCDCLWPAGAHLHLKGHTPFLLTLKRGQIWLAE